MLRIAQIFGAITIAALTGPANAQRTLAAPVQWIALLNETKEYTGTSLVIGSQKGFAMWYRTQHQGQSVWAAQFYHISTQGVYKGSHVYLAPNVSLYTTPSAKHPGHKVVFQHYPVGVLQSAIPTVSAAAANTGPAFTTEPVALDQLGIVTRAISADPTAPKPSGGIAGAIMSLYSAGMKYTSLSNGQFLRLDGDRTLKGSGYYLDLRNASGVLASWDSRSWVFLRPDMAVAVLAPIGLTK